MSYSAADPRFLRGGANPKLHENEGNWTGRGALVQNFIISATVHECVGNVGLVNINIKTEGTNKTAALDAKTPNG